MYRVEFVHLYSCTSVQLVYRVAQRANESPAKWHAGHFKGPGASESRIFTVYQKLAHGPNWANG